MPAANIDASACTRQIGSERVNQRSPGLSQMSAALAALSWPATHSRSAIATLVRSRSASGRSAPAAGGVLEPMGQ